MPIWYYSDQSLNPLAFADLNECPFCSSTLQRLFWEQRLSKSHNENYDDLMGFVCQTCGWWKATRETGIWGPYSQSRHMSKFAYQKFCQAGSLKNLYSGDLTLPLEELRSALWANHTGGFAKVLNDKDLVASVFTDPGYESLATSTSNDRGFIAILTKGAASIGILMKYKENDIEVEQILALTGALVRAGITIGAFITASSSHQDSLSIDKPIPAKGAPIKLLDAQSFYNDLKLTQIPPYRSKEEFLNAHDLNRMTRVKAYDGS
jgi:hypothetical protein